MIEYSRNFKIKICSVQRYLSVRTRKDPDHEWTIDMQGPLQGETYKRMGEDNWVLIDSNKGFE